MATINKPVYENKFETQLQDLDNKYINKDELEKINEKISISMKYTDDNLDLFNKRMDISDSLVFTVSKVLNNVQDRVMITIILLSILTLVFLVVVTIFSNKYKDLENRINYITQEYNIEIPEDLDQ